MPLVFLPDKRLRTLSKTVPLPLSNDDEMIVKEMIDHIIESKKSESDLREGIGIAAVQLGYLKRMFYINVQISDEVFDDFFINPEFIGMSDSGAALSTGEGCLSVKEKMYNDEGLVHRKFKVILKGYSYFQKKVVEITATGILAIIMQHEMDHLNGKLFIDRINNDYKWEQLEEEDLF